MSFIRILHSGKTDELDTSIKILSNLFRDSVSESYINTDVIEKATYYTETSYRQPYIFFRFRNEHTEAYRFDSPDDTLLFWRNEIVPLLVPQTKAR